MLGLSTGRLDLDESYTYPALSHPSRLHLHSIASSLISSHRVKSAGTRSTVTHATPTPPTPHDPTPTKMSTPSSDDKEKGIHITRAPTADGDDVAHRLEEMGYKQELQRNLGMVAVLGLSFAIMAVSRPLRAQRMRRVGRRLAGERLCSQRAWRAIWRARGCGDGDGRRRACGQAWPGLAGGRRGGERGWRSRGWRRVGRELRATRAARRYQSSSHWWTQTSTREKSTLASLPAASKPDRDRADRPR